jgi:hypothetical protein
MGAAAWRASMADDDMALAATMGGMIPIRKSSRFVM